MIGLSASGYDMLHELDPALLFTSSGKLRRRILMLVFLSFVSVRFFSCVQCHMSEGCIHKQTHEKLHRRLLLYASDEYADARCLPFFQQERLHTTSR